MSIVLSNILENEGIVTYFQPIVAVKRKAVFGVEALSRGIESGTGRIIPPYQLFMAATAEDRMLDLERLCRKKALESFKQHYLHGADTLLFLNFEVSVLDQGVSGSGQLMHLAEQLGIPAQRVVIEVVESKVENTEALLSFIHRHREAGFLIALDDVGAGHSNLDRIALLKPDIMKIDASLIRDLEKNYYKQEVLRSLVNLAKRIGSLVLAEGVETAPEALASLELGAEFIQGYYLGRPAAPGGEVTDEGQQATGRLAEAFRKTMVSKLKHKRAQHGLYTRQLNAALTALNDAAPEDFDAYLEAAAKEDASKEFYILDLQGQQVSSFSAISSAKAHNPLCRLNVKGTDHSLKDYYYLTFESNLKRYTTEPYISLATGRLCVTIVAWFKAKDEQDYLLCMDVNPPSEG